MFTGKPLPPLPESVARSDWSTGMFYRCKQESLTFGSDRRIPLPTRAVAELRRDAGRSVVLPCTSRGKQDDPRYFLFDPDRVRFNYATDPGLQTFAFEHYEVVPAESLLAKIGVCDHGLSLDLIEWLRGRY